MVNLFRWVVQAPTISDGMEIYQKQIFFVDPEKFGNET